MNSPWLIANLDDVSTLEGLSAEIRAWDPAFDLVRPATDALLYEPDGTLYAVALQAPMTAEFNRRTRDVLPGDLLIVPRSVPVEIEPTVDLLGVRFEGDPPDHFRERFIQVWGYDHLPAVDNPRDRRRGRSPVSRVAFDSFALRSDGTAAGVDRARSPDRDRA